MIYVTTYMARPPKGRPTMFRLEAALFRSTGHETRWLLRDVDEVISQVSHER